MKVQTIQKISCNFREKIQNFPQKNIPWATFNYLPFISGSKYDRCVIYSAFFKFLNEYIKSAFTTSISIIGKEEVLK